MRVDISGLTVLKLPEFWLLWSIEFVIVGVALMWKNHVGMFGFERDYTTIVVMSWVGVNASSRMLTGYTSDLLRNVFPRSGFFMIGACIMFVSHLLMLVAPAFGTMWLANVCTGVAYGMCICGLNQIISIYFGLQRFGFNHGMVNTSGALGGLFFTAMAEVIANAQDLKSAQCLGANRLQCYRYPFALSAGFLVVAIYLSVVAIRQYPPKFLLYRAVAAE